MTEEHETIACQVTGKAILRDDAVVFQGKWVGAEGKAILLERLRSGADEPGALATASLWKRFLGGMLDGLICTTPFIVIGLLLGFDVFDVSKNNEDEAALAGYDIYQSLFELIVTVAFIVYLTILHSRSGQTLGKMIAKTKVVRSDGSPITYSRSFVRALYLDGGNFLLEISVLIMLCIALMLPDRASELQNVFQTVVTALTAFIGVYAIVNLLAIIFDRSQRRSIHDRLAGTRVVQVS